MTSPNGSPFDLGNEAAYQRWREAKLDGYPTDPAALLVRVADPAHPSEAEHAAILERVRKTNMAVYVGPPNRADKGAPRDLGRRFGLERLDHNFLGDGDGLSSITVNPAGERPQFIPYTNRPIKWHTDGYYNAGTDRIRGMILHCVSNAAEGGDNRLLDHEIVYLLLRDEDPELVRALMQEDIMAIPARVDEDGVAREAVNGPVFSVDPETGALHMRYTARKRNIEWKDDPASRRAVARLEALLDSNLPWMFHVRLEAGMGLICNNVLHDRGGFVDHPGDPPRLLYRARYFDRISGT